MADELEFGGSVAVAAPLPFGAFEVDFGGQVGVASADPLFEPFETEFGGTVAVASEYFEPFEVDLGGSVAVASPQAPRTVIRWLEPPLVAAPGWYALTRRRWYDGDWRLV